jgi:hypothetical protein
LRLAPAAGWQELASCIGSVGLLCRALEASYEIAEAPHDLTRTCELFVAHVMDLLGAAHVRVWMVDAPSGQIWEFHPHETRPQKRTFWEAEPKVRPCPVPPPAASHDAPTPRRAAAARVRSRTPRTTRQLDTSTMFKKGRPPLLKAALLGAKPGIAADVARTGMLLNVPFPAVQSPSFAVGVDRLPHDPALTIICAPVRHKGEVVAAVQCYNKTAPGVPAPEARGFTEVDEILLGILAHHCGAVLHNCALHAHAMAAAERALNAIHLTRHYPCAAGDLFAIAWVFLSKVLLPEPLVARTDCPPT